MPMPSAPIRRERTMRYKKPKARSVIESAVMMEAVANSVRFMGSLDLVCTVFILLLYEPYVRVYDKREAHIYRGYCI